jgi:DUF4097 and DUF4098 domain-containing protein YvlB
MLVSGKKAFLLAFLSLGSLVALQAAGELREEFHQTYPLAANGRISLANVNGPVHVTEWDRNEVKVDAVKHGPTQDALKEAEIVVEARVDAISIKTKYPENNHRRDAASVDYTLTVPKGAQLDQVSTVNGAVEVQGISGPVRASSVNGTVKGRRLEGEVNLSTVNGRVEAEFRTGPAKSISLRSVNGTVSLSLPPDASVDLSAATVHGAIQSDFDLPVRKVGFGPGGNVKATIGKGGAAVRLNTVNGTILLRNGIV